MDYKLLNFSAKIYVLIMGFSVVLYGIYTVIKEGYKYFKKVTVNKVKHDFTDFLVACILTFIVIIIPTFIIYFILKYVVGYVCI